MNTLTIFSAFTALAAAAPFSSAYPAPPCPPLGTGFPAPTGGAFTLSNGTYGQHHHLHHSSGYAMPTGTGLPTLLTGTAVYKREAQLGDMTGLPSMPSFSMPSFSAPAGAGGAGISFPTGLGDGSGFGTGGSIPTETTESGASLLTGLGSSSGSGVSPPAGTMGFDSSSGFISQTGGLGSGSGSSPSVPLSTSIGAGSAPATGLSGFELARRKTQFNSQAAFSFLPMPTASFADGLPALTGSGAGMPTFALPTSLPTGATSDPPSGVASRTGAW